MPPSMTLLTPKIPKRGLHSMGDFFSSKMSMIPKGLRIVPSLRSSSLKGVHVEGHHAKKLFLKMSKTKNPIVPVLCW